MTDGGNDFARFEHAGWERVADKYDSVWSTVTRQFIPHLLRVAEIAAGMQVLDVACGPGYVSAAARELGTMPTGVDFSPKMVAIACRMCSDTPFLEGDAQQLPVADASFDRVLMNFGLLHLCHPEKACMEAFRVLRPGGKFAFSVWARPEHNPGGRVVHDALKAHADFNVDLPDGPPYDLFADKDECRTILVRAGFEAASLIFETRTVEWHVPTPSFLFEAERDAGVRTAGLLARQSAGRLEAIRHAIEGSVKQYAQDDGFAIPMAAHVIAITKAGPAH